jgi:hypothetical protein
MSCRHMGVIDCTSELAEVQMVSTFFSYIPAILYS